MIPVWLAILFGAIIMSFQAVQIPKERAFIHDLSADKAATSMISYRNAVIRYFIDHPIMNGEIPSPYEMGSAISDRYIDMGSNNCVLYGNNNTYLGECYRAWGNIVERGIVYVYSKVPFSGLPYGTLYSLHSKASQNLLIGTKSLGGRLIAFNGWDTGVLLPSSIPNGSIVIVGG